MSEVVYGSSALQQLSASMAEWETIEEGKQVKVVHQEYCDNGSDHKERMYITNKGGAFLFHCHNCGISGYYRPRDVYSPIVGKDVEHIAKISAKTTPHYYKNKYLDICSKPLSTAQRLWLAEYEMLGCTKIKSPLENYLMLPAYNPYTGLVYGYQLRHFNSGVKYSTYLDDSNVGSLSIGDTTSNRVIIVEDLLSSYKLQMAGHNAYALMGTKIHTVPEGFNEAIIWLDKDCAGQEGAIELYRELAPLFPNRIDVWYNNQPKEVPMEQLKKLFPPF